MFQFLDVVILGVVLAVAMAVSLLVFGSIQMAIVQRIAARRAHKTALPIETESPIGSSDLERIVQGLHLPSTMPQTQARQAARSILPLSSYVDILPGQRSSVAARVRTSTFRIGRLVIKNADRWIVNSIDAADHPVLLGGRDCLPGSVFSAEAIGSRMRCELIKAGDLVVLDVTYVGPLKSGEPLAACIIEADEADLPRGILPISSDVAIQTGTSVQITARVSSRVEALLPRQILLGDAEHWIINDIKIGAVSQFTQSGDVPGIVFSPTATESVFRFDTLQPGIDMAIVATYVGPEEGYFRCGIVGETPLSIEATEAATSSAWLHATMPPCALDGMQLGDSPGKRASA